MWQFLKTVGIILFAVYLLYGCGGGGGGTETRSATTTPPPTEPIPPPPPTPTPEPEPTPIPEPPKPNLDIYKETIQTVYADCYWYFKSLNDGYKCMMDRDVVYLEESLVITLSGEIVENDIETITTTIYDSNKKLWTGPLQLQNEFYDPKLTYYGKNVEMQIFMDNQLLVPGKNIIEIEVTHKSKVEDLSTIEVLKSVTSVCPNLEPPYLEGNHDVQFTPSVATNETTVSVMMHDEDRNLNIWSNDEVAHLTIKALVKDPLKTNELLISLTGKDFYYGAMDSAQYQKQISLENLALGSWYVNDVYICDFATDDLYRECKGYPSFLPEISLVIN